MRLFQVLRVVVAVGVLLGLGHLVIRQVAEPEDRLYAIIYQRGYVQYITLVVAGFALVLLYSRWRHHRHSAARFRAFEQNQGAPPEPLAQGLHKVSCILEEYGPAAAGPCVKRFYEDQSKAAQKGHDTIYFLIGMLPALGLLGTMVGLSDALFAAFCRGFDAQAVQQFVAGLSTALDTTVLAMVCAAPLFAWLFLQIRQESNLVDQYAEHLRRRFGLLDLPEGDKASYLISMELCRLTKRIGQDAKAMFAEILGASVAALRETLGEAVQKLSDEHRQRELDAMHSVSQQIADQWSEALQSVTELLERRHAKLAERLSRELADNVAHPLRAVAQQIRDHAGRVSEELPQMVSRAMAESLANAAQLLDQHHTELTNRVVHHMGRLETTLRNRTPEEVVIRYRNNGVHE